MVDGSVRTGGAINDINAITSKHGSISSRAGGIINDKFLTKKIRRRTSVTHLFAIN